MQRRDGNRNQRPKVPGTALRYLAPLALFFFLSLSSFAAYDEKDANLPRDEQGYVIHKDLHLAVPEDEKVTQVASNVIRVQDLDQYVKQRVDGLEKLIEQLSMEVSVLEKGEEELEKKVAALEPRKA